MSAIITEKFRKNNAQAFIDDIENTSNKYYVGLGKSDAWELSGGLPEDDLNFNVKDPIGTYGDVSEILNNITTFVGITGGSSGRVIPNIVAKVNHRHKAYNPYDPDCFYQTLVDGVQMYPCYVVVNDNVYLCLRTSNLVGSSYSLPNGSSQSRAPIENSDGSVWIYIYSILSSDPINVNQFVSVASSATLNGVETESAITGASGNLVYGFTVMDGGSGYVTPPVVKFVNSTTGTETTLVATVDGGSITSVNYVGGTIPLSWIKARGYVKVASGNARVYPNVAPPLGFGHRPADDLCSWYIGISIDAGEDIYTDGAYIPYRQVSIVRNPNYVGGTTQPELSLNGLKALSFGVAAAPSAVTTGARLIQASTGAIGIIDHYDSVNKYLYYHQTFATGFIAFDISPVTSEASSYTPIGLIQSEYVKGTGEVVFTENRKKISRISGQTEEITIILQF